MLNTRVDGWYVVQPGDVSIAEAKFTPSKTAPSLETLQGLVGGFIELVRLNGHNCDAFINEEGKLDGLPPNHVASYLYKGWPDYIVGPMVIVCGAARKGL
jgi:hypothetical protein